MHLRKALVTNTLFNEPFNRWFIFVFFAFSRRDAQAAILYENLYNCLDFGNSSFCNVTSHLFSADLGIFGTLYKVYDHLGSDRNIQS